MLKWVCLGAPGNVKASAIILLVDWPATYRDSSCVFDSVRQKFTEILISFFCYSLGPVTRKAYKFVLLTACNRRSGLRDVSR